MRPWVRCLDLSHANNRGWRAHSGEVDEKLTGWRWRCCYDRAAAVVIAVDGSPLVHSVRACKKRKRLSRELFQGRVSSCNS